MNYYPFFVGDYTSATVHLTMVEDSAYRRLLDHYFSHESPLPNDPERLHRICRAATPSERRAVDYVVEQYFITDGNVLRNLKADKVIAEVQKKSKEASRAAHIKWEKKRDANASANASQKHMRKGMRNVCETDANQNQTQNQIKPKPKNTSANGLFDRFWKVFPLKRDKAKARVSFDRVCKDEAQLGVLIDAITEQIEKQHFQTLDGRNAIPHPTTWLNGRRWEDEVTGPPQQTFKTETQKMMEELGMEYNPKNDPSHPDYEEPT